MKYTKAIYLIFFSFVVFTSFCLADGPIPQRDPDDEEDGVKYVPSALHFSLDFQFTMPTYNNFVWDNSSGPLTINQPSLGGRIAFEWLPITQFGKAGIALGAAFNINANQQILSLGTATLTTIPFDASVVYHFDFVRNQILVPLVKAGYEFTFVQESTSFGTDNTNGFATYSGLRLGFGLQLCLNFIEPSTAHTLDGNFGINGTYLVAEYIFSKPLNPGTPPDLTHEEYRFGLRFEF